MNRDRLLERFLRYVQIDTTANDSAGKYPSCDGQWTLGRLLVEELKSHGMKDAAQDEFGIVMATVPATGGVGRKSSAATIAWNAHLDTSPEAPGNGVRPQVIDNYRGGDIQLPGDPEQVLRFEGNRDLQACVGKTLITTDGTTLLGGDDKAGVAVIMEAAAYLMEHPEIAHGPVRVCFTCDEEIGHGVDSVDLKKLGATACYTLDGSGANDIDVETFSADLATVTVRGVNIHPSIAKGRMINAMRAVANFIGRLPSDSLAPEVTEGRQGFLHPYHIEGGVAAVAIKILLRDFDTSALAALAQRLRDNGTATMKAIQGVTVDVKITSQYRNMAEGFAREPRAVEYAKRAHARLNREARLTVIRGGTDGSRFTELGLPTPNLSTGQHNPHSPLEWACLDEMVDAAELLVALAQTWGEAE